MRTRLLAIVVILLVAEATWLYFSADSKPYKMDWEKFLPPTAKDIKNYYWDDGFHGDYTLAVKAGIDEKEYHEYAAKLGLTKKYDENDVDEKEKVDLREATMPLWWDPPSAGESTYIEIYRKDGRMRAVRTLKFSGGTVYYHAFSW